jgi:hypothetical protein
MPYVGEITQDCKCKRAGSLVPFGPTIYLEDSAWIMEKLWRI